MKCPQCQCEMAEGHLYSGGKSINWVRDAQAGWKKFLAIGNEHVTDRRGKLAGYHCSACSCLTIPNVKVKAADPS
jgi:hypothetical protein